MRKFLAIINKYLPYKAVSILSTNLFNQYEFCMSGIFLDKLAVRLKFDPSVLPEVVELPTVPEMKVVLVDLSFQSLTLFRL